MPKPDAPTDRHLWTREPDDQRVEFADPAVFKACMCAFIDFWSVVLDHADARRAKGVRR